MTLADIEAIPKDFLTSCDVAPFIGCDPNLIRWQAHNEPEKLGFPVVVLKSRVKIPKAGFLNFIKGLQAPAGG